MAAPEIHEIAQVIPQLGLWVREHPWAFAGIFGGVPLALAAVRAVLGRGTHDIPQTYGSARWATTREIRRSGLFGRDGMILGQYRGRFLMDGGEGHVLLVAPTRSGKGTGHIIPTLLTWAAPQLAWSTIVFDPIQGENYDVTANWRSRFGPVYAFTPMGAPHTRLNVLRTVRLETPKEFGDAMLISESLGAPEKMARENSTSLHFRELANLLRATGILHVLYTKQRTSLAGVWDFFTQAKDLAGVLKEMASTAHLSQGVHQGIASMTRAIENISGDRELSSVWTTTIRPLVLYSDPLVAKSTDEHDLDFEALQYGETPSTLYLIAQSTMSLEHAHPLYRVILDVAMSRLMEHKRRTWHHRLFVIADELPWYGYIRAVEKGIPVAAGYGIKCLLPIQDLESLWDVYGQHSAIWGNCHVKVFHTPDNDLTAKRISDNLLGTQTVETPVAQTSPMLGVRRSISLGHHSRPLLTTDELMNFDVAKVLICMRGLRPISGDKYDYRGDPQVQERL